MTVLTGEWRLVNGGTAPVGTEKWRLEETAEKILWNSVIEKSNPFPHREEVTVVATPRKWRIRTLRILSEGDGHEDLFEGRVENKEFSARILRDQKEDQVSISVSDSTEFDYLDLVFNTITFHRLRLRRGESREIEVVYIFPVEKQNSFQTRMVKQSYHRLADETVSVSAGQFPAAKHYVYKNLSSGWTGSMWTDNLETVLRYDKLCELLRYGHDN